MAGDDPTIGGGDTPACPLRDGQTLSTRLGGWPERVLAVAGLLAAATGVVLQRGRRRAEDPA